MRFRGVVYRAHNPRWSRSPTSGEGARLRGGRFNRVGVSAFYTSLSLVTALSEASVFGIPIQPLVMCAYRVDSKPIFDALDPARRELHAVRDFELRCPDWEREMLEGRIAPSQALADRLIGAGFAGMLVPAFCRGAGPEDRNLVLWKWGGALPSRVQLVDDEGRLTPE